MATRQAQTLTVQGNEIALKRTKLADYIDLTGIARSREVEHPDDLNPIVDPSVEEHVATDGD